MTKTNPVAGVRGVDYARDSTTKQEASIPEQQDWARGACRANGVDLVRGFQDHGIPGDEVRSRKGLQALLDFCEHEDRQGRTVQVVVVWDVDRLSRGTSFQTGALLDRLMGHGVRWLLTVKGLLDLYDVKQRLFLNLEMDLGKQAYSKSIAQSVARNRFARAREGFWTGGRPAYGYVVGPDGRLALGDPVEVETVRWLFRNYLDRDAGLRVLAGELAGLRRTAPQRSTKNGWTNTVVRNILRNPTYTGTLLYNRTTQAKYWQVRGGEPVERPGGQLRPGQKPRPHANPAGEQIAVEDAHPAIIDRATFDAVQAKLTSGRLGYAARRVKVSYPFGGLVRCGECGATMHGVTIVKKTPTKTYRWRKYLCSTYKGSGGVDCHMNTIPEGDLLDRIADVIREHFADPAIVAEMQADLAAGRQKQGRAFEGELDALRARADELAGMIDRGTENLLLVPKEQMPRASAKLRAWEDERARLLGEAREIEGALAARREDEAETGNALALLAELGETIRTADPEKLRAVARGLVERVDLRFAHETLPSGRVRSVVVDGDIHLRIDLGCSVPWGSGCGTPPQVAPITLHVNFTPGRAG